jgi:hypothetical protein
VDGEGNTVVYSVFVMKTRVDDIEFVTPGTVVGRVLFVDDGAEREAAGTLWLELTGPAEDDACTADLEITVPAAGKLTGILVICKLCDAKPGWLKPGIPVELPVTGLLVTTGVGETIGLLDPLSSGAYVKAGMFVPLTCPLSTAALELTGTTEAEVPGKGPLLLCKECVEDLSVWEDKGTIIELTGVDGWSAGIGVGVK